MARLQYPILAEPVFVPGANDATLDRWFSPAAQPMRRPPPRHAALAASGAVYVAEPAVFAAAETITLDKWWTETARPGPFARSRRAALAASGAVFVGDPAGFAALETVTLDKWFRELSQPYLARPRLNRGTVTAPVFVPDDVPLDRWFRALSQPTRPRPRLTHGGSVAPVAPPEVPPDRWLSPSAPQALRERTRYAAQVASGLAYVGDPATLAPEATSLDKWFREASQPVLRSLSRAAALGASGAIYVGEPIAAPASTDTIRERCFARLLATLQAISHTGLAASDVERNRTDAFRPEQAPAITVLESPEDAVETETAELKIMATAATVEGCVTAATTAALGPALNALYAAVIEAVEADKTLGGMALGVFERTIATAVDREGHRPFAVFSIELAIRYQTARTDPSALAV